MAATRPSAPVTQQELQIRSNEELAEKERIRLTIAEQYAAQQKVAVTGSPMYRPYFGNAMPISLNGIFISVPLDGTPYNIPKSFAEVFFTRIRSVDDDLNMQKRLSSIKENSESFAGELDLIQRA